MQINSGNIIVGPILELLHIEEIEKAINRLALEFKKAQPFVNIDKNFRFLHDCGYTFNSINEQIFDRVFVVPTERTYQNSTSEQLLESHFLINQSEGNFQKSFLQFHSAVEDFSACITDDLYHRPGYTVTSSAFQERPRIPIHLHKGRSIFDTGEEVTLSIGFNFKRIGPSRGSFNFYSQSHPINMNRTQEELFDQGVCTKIPLDGLIHVVLFNASWIPHTVIFPKDHFIWAVFNGIRPKKILRRSKDTILYLGKYS